MILKKKVRETIDFIQTRRMYGRINHDLIDEINIPTTLYCSVTFTLCNTSKSFAL